MSVERQEYTHRPLTTEEVRGTSSQTIFEFMAMPVATRRVSMERVHPWDLDDWERNRALLLQYPEWKARLPEMGTISLAWATLVAHWAAIELLYETDDVACNMLIRACVKPQ